MRIVSLLPSATDILVAIGAGPELIAVTHECDLPANFNLPAVTRSNLDHTHSSAREIDTHIVEARHSGSSIYGLDVALLHQLRPDLIITQELCDVCAVAYSEVTAAVRRLSHNVQVLSLEPRNLGDILQTITAVGKAVRHDAEAAGVVSELQMRIDRVAQSPLPQPPRVLCLEWTDPLMVGGHWVPEMVQLAGGSDVLGELGSPSRYVSIEDVIEADPDLIVAMPCGFTLEKSRQLTSDLLRYEQFQALRAVCDGAVFAVDGSHYFNRPGPHIVKGLEILARIFRSEPSPHYATVSTAVGSSL